MNIKNGDKVSLTSGVSTSLHVSDVPSREITYQVKVLTGTVKFGTGGINANSYAVPEGEIFLWTSPNGHLFAQAQGGAAEIWVTT